MLYHVVLTSNFDFMEVPEQVLYAYKTREEAYDLCEAYNEQYSSAVSPLCAVVVSDSYICWPASIIMNQEGDYYNER